MTRHADWLFVVLAWVYVALRLAHAYIHVTDKRGQVGATSGPGETFLRGLLPFSLAISLPMRDGAGQAG
jgi:hypothetical protein